MSKKNQKQKNQSRQTNWFIIIGVGVVGVVGLFALLLLNMQPQQVITLEERCDQDEAVCVSVGAADAPVKMIEVLDFGCPHCRDFHEQTSPLLDQLYVQTGQVQFVYYPYALSAQTIPATNASLCAQEQNAYATYVDALFDQFETADARERAGLLRAAEAVGLDMEAFTACVDDGRYNKTIQQNIEVARRQRVSSTPTFFINGRVISGARPFTDFQQQIERALNLEVTE
ncbi:MAG: DsbA family protein [Ardenticatenaceae bacterium]|nr:DsbA family protein [Ardenticatenaceae bacterium]